MDSFARIDGYLRLFRRRLLTELALAALGASAIVFSGALVATIAAIALLPGLEPLRWGLLTVLGLLVLGMSIWLFGPVWSRVRRPENLAAELEVMEPSLGHGLCTVINLAPRRNDPEPSFSPELLEAEAARIAGVLETMAPEMPDRRRVAMRRFAMAGAILLVAGVVSLVAPWDTLRAIRGILGFGHRPVPSWLTGPPTTVDGLVFDLRTEVLRRLPDGTIERLPGDETGDVIALSGMSVEVSGRLSQSAVSGHIVLEGPKEARIPLVLKPGGAFSAVFPVTGPGTWHVSVVIPPGVLLRERARRRVVPAELEPPRVQVTQPGRVAMQPGETVALRYAIEAPSGISGVDMVILYPLEPERPVQRTHLIDLPPGTRNASGEVVFTMPADALDSGGRVDLIVEALGRLATGPENAGRSEPVRFHVDHPRVLGLVRVEALERAQEAVLEILASMLDPAPSPVATDGRLSAESFTRLGALLRAESGDGLESMAADVEVAGRVPDDEALAILERVALALDDLLVQEKVALFGSRLRNLSREAERLRVAGRRGSQSRDIALGAAIRSQRTMVQLDRTRRKFKFRAAVEEGMARLAWTALGTLHMRTRDVLTSVEQVLRNPDSGETELAAATELGADAIAEVVRAFRESAPPSMATEVREEALPPEVDVGIRQAITLQREVMDRTAQAAYLMKRRMDAFSQERSPGVARLLSQVEEARDGLARVSMDPLDPPDAQSLAAIREDLSTLRDLLAAGDLDSAWRVIRDVNDRLAQVVVDVRDQAEWIGEDREDDAADLRAQAGRMARVLALLREPYRGLSTWHKERAAAMEGADREELVDMRKAQEKVLSVMTRVAETLRRLSGSDSEESTSAALSARRNMDESARRLAESNPLSAEVHQRQAIQDLLRLRRTLERTGSDLGRRQVYADGTEGVTISAGTSPRRPDAFEREVQVFLSDPVPPEYEEVVRAYYEAILRP
jgi:hypothetical protein